MAESTECNSSDIDLGLGMCVKHDFWYTTYSELNHHLIREHST